jgi:multiple antibiotic resistance protein
MRPSPVRPHPYRRVWKPLYWNMDSTGYYILWMMQLENVTEKVQQNLVLEGGDPVFLSPKRTYNSDQTTMDLLPGIIYSFAALFIILDPLLSVPIFAAMTKGQTATEIHKQAFIAVAVAGSLMYLFLIFNKMIFEILGLSLPSFQIAGGILLFLLGIQEALGIEIGHCKEHAKTAAGVVIGTPLLCGPGTITTVMLLSKDYGILIPFVAITISLLATWAILYYSELIQRILGEVVTDIMGKVLGMLVAAIAVKIIASGVMALAGM